MSIENSLLISYSDVFEKLETPKEELLREFDRDLLLLSGTALVNMSKPNSPFHDYKKLLSTWFSEKNETALNEIYNKIKSKEKEFKKVSVLNIVSSLQLIDHAISRGYVEDVQNEDKSAIEIPLLKFYLLLNSENIKDEIIKKSTEDEKDENKLCAFILSQTLAYNDIAHYDIIDVIVTQFVKSIYLLDFISREEKYQKIYATFLTQFEIADWKDYLRYYTPLVFASTRSQNRFSYTDHVIEKNEKYAISCNFLDKHILDIDEEIPNSDFRYLRSKPFYKVEEGKYRAIYDLFIAEKTYNGLHFVLSSINSNFPKAERIDIKGELGGNFSENHLFYSVIERITQLKYKGFRGQVLKETYQNILPSEPDYYLRNGKNVMLFESKDVLLKADVKISYDYKMIREELSKKFYKEGTSDKAVLQLIRNIKRVLKQEFPFDKDYKVKNVNIYPIVITHHRMYDTSGVNYLINTWFKEELAKLSAENLEISKVRPLTIINIDTLIIYNDLFRSKKMSLSDLIDEYSALKTPNTQKKYKNEEAVRQAILKKFLPFSAFVDEYANRNDLKPTFSLFREMGIELVTDIALSV